jgi:hypothetical protein
MNKDIIPEYSKSHKRYDYNNTSIPEFLMVLL